MEYQEKDVVLCVVEKIAGTTVFVKIENNIEGTITFSEIAPGRIRNIRDYVSPGRRIVCKILRKDSNGTLNLSLRRVTSKEKKEVMDNYDKEKTGISIIRRIVGKDSEEIIKKIYEKEGNVYNFLQKSKDKKIELQKYLTKEQTENIIKILNEKKEKFKEIKRGFFLKCKKEDGIERIKEILLPHQENIIYLGAGRFSISKKASDYKQAEKEIDKILGNIEENSRKEKCDFEVIEK
jgi:translation initiation factor 2 alpha subunit (eIF-2alpha)